MNRLALALLLVLPSTALAKEATARFAYTGWKCAACAGKVEKKAKTLKGVGKATATLDVLTVVYDDAKTSPDALAKALVLEGFTFRPLTTTTAADPSR